MRTRKAILPDAKHIHDLISGYSGDGTLLLFELKAFEFSRVIAGFLPQLHRTL